MKINHHIRSLSLPIFLGVTLALLPRAEAQEVIKLASNVDASFRGIHVVSQREAWVSGTNGTLLRTTDGGSTWTPVKVPHSEELDFRDIEVLPDGSVILMSIGNGLSSKVFRSADHGRTWNVVLQNQDEAGFFDGMDFQSDGKRGALFGDPIDGRLALFVTEDAGTTWRKLKPAETPPLAEGEYSFAASGTGLVFDDSGIMIATGGSVARIHRTTDGGKTWDALETPLPAGSPSSGIFSFARHPAGHSVIVGGDYKNPLQSGRNVAVASTNFDFAVPPQDLGHKACVQFVSRTVLVTCGRTGVDLSIDLGQSWTHLTDDKYYTLGVDTGSRTVYLAGPDGAIGRLDLPESITSAIRNR